MITLKIFACRLLGDLFERGGPTVRVTHGVHLAATVAHHLYP